jgi:hypothetical protein
MSMEDDDKAKRNPVVHAWRGCGLWCGYMYLHDDTTHDPQRITCPRCMAAMKKEQCDSHSEANGALSDLESE